VLCAVAGSEALVLVTLPESEAVDGSPSLGKPCTVEHILSPEWDIYYSAFQLVRSEVYCIPNTIHAGGYLYRFNRETRKWDSLPGFTDDNGRCRTKPSCFTIGGDLYVHVSGYAVEDEKLWRYCPDKNEEVEWVALPFCPLLRDVWEPGYHGIVDVTASSMYGVFRDTMYSFTPGAKEEWRLEGEWPGYMVCHRCPVGPYVVSVRDSVRHPRVYDPVSGEWVTTLSSAKALFADRQGATYRTMAGIGMISPFHCPVEIMQEGSSLYVSVVMVDTRIEQNGGGGGFET
ncbi:hypothetical protein KIPB_007363, partial [Kipferlia bialata]